MGLTNLVIFRNLKKVKNLLYQITIQVLTHSQSWA